MKSKFKIGDTVTVNLPTGNKVGIIKYIARQDEAFIYSVNVKESSDSEGVQVACNESCLSLINEV